MTGLDLTPPDDLSDDERGLVELLRESAVQMLPDGTVLETDDVLGALRALQQEFVRFRLYYKFGIDEVLTKISILREEFEQAHDYSPIEHVRHRLKSMESLMQKVIRTGTDLSIPAIRNSIHDIAGIRITCSFVSDAYWVRDMLAQQPDLEVITTKDYIANPKPNGYRSLHMIVRVPVFLSDRTEHVDVEIQLRTIAMDFWASTEHKLYYKFGREVPAHLLAQLTETAQMAAELDDRMARLRTEINGVGGPGATAGR